MPSRWFVPLAFSAFAALGATCKGAEGEPPPANAKAQGKPATPPPERPQITEIEGVEVSSVPPARRADFVRILNETFCYCGCPRTLAACLSNRESCACVRCSERMAQFIQKHFEAGMGTEEVESMILEGYSESYNGPLREFDLADHGTKGSDTPQFTIVEFADFRCGHCREAHPVLRDLVEKQPGLRLVYFYYPLGGDDSPSVLAAEAAEEARQQGKFWPMADLLYQQHEIDRPTLDTLAQKVGLDMDRFKKALDGNLHRPRVLADKRLGQKYAVASTPTLFINGRLYGFPNVREYFLERLAMEAERGQCN